ncbi:MAG: hypothetical protein ACLR3C_03310 [Eggerthella lenta]
MRFELDDEGRRGASRKARAKSGLRRGSADAGRAMASRFGLVEKIDFDNLTFDGR